MATATGIGGSMGRNDSNIQYVKCQDEVLWVYVCSIVNQLSVHYVLCIAALDSYPSDIAIGTLTLTIV